MAAATVFIEKGANISEIDKGCKNKWSWGWLDSIDSLGDKIELWCKKTNHKGEAFCVPCCKPVKYTSGKFDLIKHTKCNQAGKNKHAEAVKVFKENTKLPGAVSDTDDPRQRSMLDRTTDVKCMVAAFMAQHCMPCSMAGPLMDLSKRLAEDQVAVEKTTFARTCATYVTTHGVGDYVKSSLKEILNETFFSLNVDEGTNNAGRKVMNVLVQYFNESENKVIIDLLGSREVLVSNSKAIFNVLDTLLNERDLQWNQVISCCMDNCNTMRGCKTGLIALIKEKNPHLLDVGGDPVHKISNAAKALAAPLMSVIDIDKLASAVHTDIEDSPKFKALFKKLQEALFDGKSWCILRSAPTRFLYMLQTCKRLIWLWDALRLFYLGYLDEEEQTKYSSLMKDLTASQKGQLKTIHASIKTSKKTEPGNARIQKILFFLFNKKDETEIVLNTLHCILQQFQQFVKLFQGQKPMSQCAHTSMFELTKTFASCFLKQDIIPTFNAKKLAKIRYKRSKNQLRNRELFVGGESKLMIIKKMRSGKEVDKEFTSLFFQKLREAYIVGMDGLLKLNMNNEALVRLAAISPSNLQSSATSLNKLAMNLGNVLSPAECSNLDIECRKYQVDDKLITREVDETSPHFRCDSDWWVKIFESQKYPTLSKLVKALLSVVVGPLVESTFNIMDDMMEEDQSRMRQDHLEAKLMIKYYLDARNIQAADLQICSKLRKRVMTSRRRSQLKELKHVKKAKKVSVAKSSKHPAKSKKSSKKTDSGKIAAYKSKPAGPLTDKTKASKHPVKAPLVTDSAVSVQAVGASFVTQKHTMAGSSSKKRKITSLLQEEAHLEASSSSLSVPEEEVVIGTHPGDATISLSVPEEEEVLIVGPGKKDQQQITSFFKKAP